MKAAPRTGLHNTSEAELAFYVLKIPLRVCYRRRECNEVSG